MFLDYIITSSCHFCYLDCSFCSPEHSLKIISLSLEFIGKLKFNFSDETFENFVTQKAFNRHYIQFRKRPNYFIGLGLYSIVHLPLLRTISLVNVLCRTILSNSIEFLIINSGILKLPSYSLAGTLDKAYFLIASCLLPLCFH